MDVVQVVAGLIWKDDKFLICQRPKNKARALLWEFVGGKVEVGETLPDALVRECKEELDVTISVKDKYMSVVHTYPDLTVQLTLFNAQIVQGNIKMIEHNDIKWITVNQIDDYQFCPADVEILQKLKRDFDTN